MYGITSHSGKMRVEHKIRFHLDFLDLNFLNLQKNSTLEKSLTGLMVHSIELESRNSELEMTLRRVDCVPEKCQINVSTVVDSIVSQDQHITGRCVICV